MVLWRLKIEALMKDYMMALLNLLIKFDDLYRIG